METASRHLATRPPKAASQLSYHRRPAGVPLSQLAPTPAEAYPSCLCDTALGAPHVSRPHPESSRTQQRGLQGSPAQESAPEFSISGHFQPQHLPSSVQCVRIPHHCVTASWVTFISTPVGILPLRGILENRPGPVTLCYKSRWPPVPTTVTPNPSPS